MNLLNTSSQQAEEMASSTYYEILNLPAPPTTTNLTPQILKLAYHKALLRYHPDKAGVPGQESHHPPHNHTQPQPTRTRQGGKKYTIDEITTAYKTLRDPSQRSEYDLSLRLAPSQRNENPGGSKTPDVFHTGLEVLDLEDLSAEDGPDGMVWYRSCRCGDERGFLVTEDELEREVESGEIVLGCRGCSLWVKVLFGVEG